MADPLSIAGLVISVAQVCASVGTKIVHFTRQVSTVDEHLDSFISQIESIETAVQAIGSLLEPSARFTLQRPDASPVLRAISLPLSHLDRCMKRVSQTLDNVAGFSENTDGTFPTTRKDATGIAKKIVQTILMQLTEGDLVKHQAALQIHLQSVNLALSVLQVHIATSRTSATIDVKAWADAVDLARLRSNICDLEAKGAGTDAHGDLLDDEESRGRVELCDIASRIVDEATEKSRSRTDLGTQQIPRHFALHANSLPVDMASIPRAPTHRFVQRGEIVSGYWELISMLRSILAAGYVGLLCYLTTLNNTTASQIFSIEDLDYRSFATSAVLVTALGTAGILFLTWAHGGHCKWHLIGNTFRYPANCAVWDIWFLVTFATIGGVSLEFSISITRDIAYQYPTVAASLRCATVVALLVALMSLGNSLFVAQALLLERGKRAMVVGGAWLPTLSAV